MFRILRDIKALRERREQRALVELQSRNRFRDSVKETSTRLRRHIEQERMNIRREEASKYEEIAGHKISVEQMNQLIYATERARTQFSALKDRSRQLQAIVRQATSDASNAKVDHAAQYKAERKWTKVVDGTMQRYEAEEERSQELVNEDLILAVKRSGW